MNLIAATFAIGCLGPGRWSLDNAIDFELHGWGGLVVTLVIGLGGAAGLLAVFWRPPAPGPDSVSAEARTKIAARTLRIFQNPEEKYQSRLRGVMVNKK